MDKIYVKNKVIRNFKGGSQTYATITGINDKQTYFLNYYIHYPISDNEKQPIEKYKKIYYDTINQFANKPLTIFEKFIDAWSIDAYKEVETIGPEFTMAVLEFYNEVDNEEKNYDLYAEWIREASIRDMIYNISLYDNGFKFIKLRNILNINIWIQKNILV